VGNELNIFSLSASTPEDSLLHGTATARPGSQASSGPIINLACLFEFDAQCSAQLALAHSLGTPGTLNAKGEDND
jgi:hypothetical protein